MILGSGVGGSTPLPRTGHRGTGFLFRTRPPSPVIGKDLVVTVDASSFAGAGFTQVLAVNKALVAPQVTPWGEVPISRPSGVLLTQTLPGSGLNIHVITVPNDPNVIGYLMYAQGLIRNGTGGLIGPCNAEEVTLGCTAG